MAIRNGKSTFFKNTIRNVIILIIKTFEFHFFGDVEDNVSKAMIVFKICFLTEKKP